MSIDRMKRVTILAPAHRADRLVEWLQKLRLVHFEDASSRLEASDSLARPGPSTELVDARIRQLEAIEHVLDTFAPVKRTFLQSLVPMPMRVKASELARVARELQLEPLYNECCSILEEFKEHEKVISSAEAEIAALEFFRGLPFAPNQLARLHHTRAWIGSLPAAAWDKLQEAAIPLLAFQELSRDKRTVHICCVAHLSASDEAARLLREHSFIEQPVRAFEGPISERIEELRAIIGGRRDARRGLAQRAEELSRHRREVEILFGHLLAERARIEALGQTAASRRISALCGYVRAADAGELTRVLAGEFPGASATYADPTPEDAVPVSLTHSRLVKPIRFLVDMFGLPDYFSFDPTPYLSLSFLIFFGICFGDVVYGLMLCAVAGYLARKARGYEGLHNFCMLFLYAGLSTIFFGVLTGSWAADLWRAEYLGAGNPILWLKEHTALLDPLEKAVVLLIVCLSIGILNQLYGIVLKGYGLLRRGDFAGAVFDAGLWLVMIPSFLIVVSPLFFPTPQWLFRWALAAMALAGTGLILTQGRKEKGVAAKAITGLVSIYGIMGSYGCISFVGDMLSYSRLLALGLTTSIIGLSFNIIAGLVRQVPWVGIILFLLVLLFGHLFNFAVSILGAFVHPARLIFLEFFSRFYESGGVRFRPLSPDSERLIVEVSDAP